MRVIGVIRVIRVIRSIRLIRVIRGSRVVWVTRDVGVIRVIGVFIVIKVIISGPSLSACVGALCNQTPMQIRARMKYRKVLLILLVRLSELLPWSTFL